MLLAAPASRRRGRAAAVSLRYFYAAAVGIRQETPVPFRPQ